MGTIYVDPWNVDATKCVHQGDPEDWQCHCVHDWRITGPVGSTAYFGNVPKTGNADSDGK